MNSTIKSSVSLQKSIWKRLRKYRNKSGVINDALEHYFQRIESLEKAENYYWETVEKSLRGKNTEYISANPGQKEITDEGLEETLWK